ncbi:SWF or SNF family helicase [Streptomyces uncialis]|uniref:SWF or SNF family helicase n=1 Tax=Streptomyces uncialis TaxID=1048205 RepID=UPI0037A1817A
MTGPRGFDDFDDVDGFAGPRHVEHLDDMDETDRTEHGTERTFAALPPARGRGFAQTWWGQAWLKALEDTALDSEQLKAGRALARAGAVGAVSVRPGRITGVVRNRDGGAHRSDVLLQRLGDDEWDRLLDMAVERAGHIAALLDRDMPPHLVEDAAAAGVELLPGIGDLEPECDCEAWDHCRHTAALCYQVARLLDQDPFVLFLMRGRDERVVLDELQFRSVTRAEPARDEDGPEPDEGVDATEAFAAGCILPPLPASPELPLEPGSPPSLDIETRPAEGVDGEALEFLALQTAAEAHRLLSEALAPQHGQRPLTSPLTLEQDAVRLATGASGRDFAARLAVASGRSGAELALAVRAWRYAGADAVSALEDSIPPTAESLARARAAVEGAWEDDERPVLSEEGRRWTSADTGAQVRADEDGRWWPFRQEGGQWVPAGVPARDPATALATAQGAD